MFRLFLCIFLVLLSFESSKAQSKDEISLDECINMVNKGDFGSGGNEIICRRGNLYDLPSPFLIKCLRAMDAKISLKTENREASFSKLDDLLRACEYYFFTPQPQTSNQWGPWSDYGEFPEELYDLFISVRPKSLPDY